MAGSRSRADLMVDIGMGRRISSLVASHILAQLSNHGQRPDALLLTQSRFTAKEDKLSQGTVVLDSPSTASIRYAPCCRPVPGDPIVGFITRGYGVSVHRADCPNASEEKRKEQPDRWIHVSWGTDTNDSYPTTIEAVCKDRLNLLLDISSALSTTKTFVLGLNTRSTEDGFAIIRIEIQIKDGAQLSTLMNKLHQISGVLQVNRPVG